MRAALHPTEWEILEATCAGLRAGCDVVWAGIAQTRLDPRWIAFSGVDAHMPLPPEPDQGWRELEGRLPDTIVAFLDPARPRRSYICGLLPRIALTVVAVPGPTSSAEQVASDVCAALERLSAVAPAGSPGPGFRLCAAHHFGPLHAWDWLSIPSGRG